MSSAASLLRASELEREQPFLTLPHALGEIPRGAMTEIAGPASSGRTAFLCSMLAAVTARQETCALIDAHNSFDPASAADAGVHLGQLLWVQCRGNVEHALKAADWLVHAGGFGLVALDLGHTPEPVSRRIPLAAWFRLRKAVENTNTAFAVLGQRVHATSCSALKIDLSRRETVWKGTGAGPGSLLQSFTVTAAHTRNHRRQETAVTLQR